MSFNKGIRGGKFLPPEWFDLDRGENMAIETFKDTLKKYQADIEPFSDAGCPVCGAASAAHLGNIWNNGAHVGDAWECEECGFEYCCMGTYPRE